MPNEFGLPSEVMLLLARALPSMVHIELLLLLHRTSPRAWAAHEAAAELRSSPELVMTAVADLQASRLVDPRPGTLPAAFAFSADAESAAAVASLQQVYDTRPVTLIKALYKRPSSAVQAFADAFRVRPPEER